MGILKTDVNRLHGGSDPNERPRKNAPLAGADPQKWPADGIRLVTCKTIMSRSRIPGLEYCINPYVGCLHGCVYCYARFMNRFSPQSRVWGHFVDVKINAVDVLKNQLKKLKNVNVNLSTVTDPYQPVEGKFKLTRQILAELAASRAHVSILTKSGLVERDIDILKQFTPGTCEVGFSMTGLDEQIRQDFEFRSPPVRNRIRALKKLHREGIKTWVFIAPVLPFLTDRSIRNLLEEIRDSVDYIMVDSLNIRSGNWKGIARILREKYPSLSSRWEAICFSPAEKKRYQDHFRSMIEHIAQASQFKLEFC